MTYRRVLSALGACLSLCAGLLSTAAQAAPVRLCAE